MRLPARRLLAALALLLLSPTLLATAATAPREDVRTLVDHTLDAIVADRARIARDPAAARALIRREVLPHIDTRHAARYVLGPHWAGASTAQRRRFTAAFTRQMIRVYAAGLHAYTDRIVDFARGDRPISYINRQWTRDRATVSAIVRNDRGDGRTELNVYLEHLGGEWKVFDVQVAGLSVLATYRAGVQSQLLFMDLDGLIARMEAHNAR